jgi:hypothetical protein
MRIAAFGLSVLVVLVLAWWATSIELPAWGQPPQSPSAPPTLGARIPLAAAGDLMAFSSETGSGPAQVTLIGYLLVLSSTAVVPCRARSARCSSSSKVPSPDDCGV